MPVIKEINILDECRRVLLEEADVIRGAADRIDAEFPKAVEAMRSALNSGGKIVVSGVGKSGNVARKLASTLTSTGSMAIFLHPTEALHGDLGVIGEQDIFLLFSHSGSTEELLNILPSVRSRAKHIIAVIGSRQGSLARHSDIVIHANVPREACRNNLAPTSSTTLQMALGDALAICLQGLSGFSEKEFARLHPGGALGKRLHTAVSDLMHRDENLVLLAPEASVEEVLVTLTTTRLSGVCIVDGKSRSGGSLLVGIVTEGDIRRALLRKSEFFELKARDIMTKNPTLIGPNAPASEALRVMENREPQLSFLPVVDDDGSCVGALRLHDLVLAGLS
jgi:arabinose-5-phosphate isomerase